MVSLTQLLAATPPDQLGAVAVESRAEACLKAAKRGDVLSWGQYAMPQSFGLPPCKPLHGHIVKSRMSELSVTRAPRGFAKTSVGGLVQMFDALNAPGAPFDFYLNIQANDDKALAVNRAIKLELEENEVLQRVYGDQRGSRWTDAEFVLRNGVIFKAAGAGASLRGTQYRRKRPNVVAVDDLYNEEDIYNRDQTIKKNEWLKSTMMNALAGGRTSFRITGTAINRSDILEEAKSWDGCDFAAFAAVDDKGQPIWPEHMDLTKLAKRKGILGSLIYNRELMGVLGDEADAIVKSAWLEGWEYDPDAMWAKVFSNPNGEIQISRSIVSCDPSTGEKETNDPAGFASVIETCGPGTRKDWWIEALHNERLSFDARLKQLERMRSALDIRFPTNPCSVVYIETVGGFKDFGEQAKTRTSLPVEMVPFVKGKLANLASKGMHFENGRIHISRAISKEDRDEALSQITTNKPPHDDVRDAILMPLEDMTASWEQAYG